MESPFKNLCVLKHFTGERIINSFKISSFVKIAIASESPDRKAVVSRNGARALYYLIFNDGKLISKTRNFFSSGGGAAGWAQVKMYFLEEKVELFIAEEIGPNMDQALKSKNIRFKSFKGTVNNALKEANK
jgi:predicted Fe-Mo cluster-binding NifX family protein